MTGPSADERCRRAQGDEMVEHVVERSLARHRSGEAVKINKVIMYWKTANGNEYTIDIASKNKTWKTVFE
jgi:hypothetical protein